MNQAHLHLLIAHLPVIGSILGGLVLVHGLWTMTNQTIIAAYNLFIISSIGAVIAYWTGEAATKTVDNIQGISKIVIEQHEDSAMIALVALIILGLVSLIGLFLTIKKSSFSRTVAWCILFFSIISFGLVARTCYIGGRIRHTEIHSAFAAPGQNCAKKFIAILS